MQDLSRTTRAAISALAADAINLDVGRALFIGELTVKTHLLHIFAKLGVD